MCWHMKLAASAGQKRVLCCGDTHPSRQVTQFFQYSGPGRRKPGSTETQMFFRSKWSTINFNENFAHRQPSFPRHLLHSSYSINSPSFFIFKENKRCFQPSPFHSVWLISEKQCCWLCLCRYSLAVQMCYLNYNAGNTFVSVAFSLLYQALKLWSEESTVSWAPLCFALFTS